MSGHALAGESRLRATAIRVVAGRSDLLAAAAIVGLLTAVVAARWAAIQGAVADPIGIGLGFGMALAAVAVIGHAGARTEAPILSRRRGPELPWSVAIGLVGGGVLVALALVGRAIGGSGLAVPPVRGDLFAPWALATIVVASGEEAVLRGVLFDRLLRGAGPWPAILVTSLAFALMHVPFYGWRVVPLDLGVGIWFAGLRLWSGGIVAPSISHALADLATWWL